MKFGFSVIKSIMAICAVWVAILFVASIYTIVKEGVWLGWRAPFNEFEELEAESIIVEAVSRRYHGSRFDKVEVFFSGPVLAVTLHDSKACSNGATIQSLERVVDLSVYTDKTASTRMVDYRDEPLTFVTFTKWRAHNRGLSAKKSKILAQARAEVGWGREAAVLASERFLQEHPRDTLSSYEIVGYCSAGSGISFDRDFMTFQVTDQQKLLDAMLVISRRGRR